GTLNFGTNNIALTGNTISTTGNNNDLTLTPNGSGNTVLSSDADSGVRVGSSSNTPAPLSISGGIGSNASLIVNNTNSGDLIAASSSAATKFTVASTGAITIAGGQTTDLDTLTATTLKIGASTQSGLTL